MNANDLNSFRSRIERALIDLEESAAAIRSELRESSEVNPLRNRVDCVKGDIDLNTSVKIHRHTVERHTQLAAALARIKNGTFGVCMECGEDIGTRRLDACLNATHCIDCMGSIERRVRPEPKREAYVPLWLGTPIPEIEEAA